VVYIGDSWQLTSVLSQPYPGLFVRDDFTQTTKDLIAKRAGYLCSNPECRCATVGAAHGHEGIVMLGVAAHITAASPGGPRFDPLLSPEQRRHQSNGIWLCQNHGKLVDSDSAQFTVETLGQWKQAAELRSFRALVAQAGGHTEHPATEALDPAVEDLVNRLGLPPGDDVLSILGRMLRAAEADLHAFKRMPGWPQHAVALNLRMTERGSERVFDVSGLAAALDSFNEIAVVAPPGTGKTTTLIQLADAILFQAKSAPAFLPLGEWSLQSGSLFQALMQRAAFRDAREEHLTLLAHHGRLALLLDGWNELDAEARRRATAEINRLRRDFPRLGLVVTTRRQALQVPLAGPVVEIDILTSDQQREMAHASQGDDGVALVDQAIRTPGVRELISVPLYLAALLAHAPHGTMPTTKEEVLRLFITEHERPPEKAAALREALFGFHADMLTALAVEATRAANTAISDARARAVVSQVERDLSAADQISAAPQPTAVLDVLVSQHTLVRSGAENGAVSFQHQQFQEWYASFEVERTMRAAANQDPNARNRLRADMFNLATWEEPILFACDRLSRGDRAEPNSVAAAIMSGLTIDPMLAAEMIYRSSAEVWNRVRDDITAFVRRWHTPGSVDRAVRFMITSARPEFAEQIWPLITNPDTQVHLPALRDARRFRPAVLGEGASARMTEVPSDTRANILAEIAMRSGIDGIEFATTLAKNDPSAAVQVAVIEALQFRRADRHVSELLGAALADTWPMLARKGYAEEITDPAAANRLRTERQCQIANEPNPLVRFGLLLESAGDSATEGQQIGEAIATADFPVGDQHTAWRLNSAFKRYPAQVSEALLRRLDSGFELPFHAEEFLESAPTIDDGPIATLALETDAKMRGFVAATVAGPKTAGLLIDAFLVRATSPGRMDKPTQEQFHQLRDRLAATRVPSFIPALLARSSTTDPQTIALLADILGRRGSDEARKHALILEGSLLRELIFAIRQWVDALLQSSQSTRGQLAEVASAIGRLGRPELLPELKRLLDEDLSRWRRAREVRKAAYSTMTIEQRSDAATSWILQYQQAFAQIGGDQVVEMMRDYLEQPDFGFHAGLVLKAAWDREHNSTPPAWNSRWPDFSDVKASRLRKATASPTNTSRPAEMIFAAIDRLIRSGDSDGQRLAIALGRIGLALPHDDKTAIITALVDAPQPIRAKRELLAAVVLDGATISADLVLQGVRAWLDQAQQDTWMFREGMWEIEGWLELLPFSDRPDATIEGIELVSAALSHPRRMERVLSSLAHAPDDDAETVMLELVRQHPYLANQHDWVKAFLERGTISAARTLIDLVYDGGLPSTHGPFDSWWISRELSPFVQAHAELKSELLRRYQSAPDGAGRNVIERILSELGDSESVLAIVRAHAASARAFNGFLEHAIREAGLTKQPAVGWVGAYEEHPAALTQLRKELFGMLSGPPRAAALAERCLTAIDVLRDEYGPAEFEPRHPDVESGQPWPLEAEPAQRSGT
jgi:NACHT conflict system protein